MAAPFEAQFIMGNPTYENHTPGADVAAGAVVVVADTPRIAHRAIPASELGALASGDGSGVYDCKGDAAIAANKKVYWVAATKKVSESAAAGANKPFGITVTACAADASYCHVRHDVGV